jgi:hypothetical protein
MCLHEDAVGSNAEKAAVRSRQRSQRAMSAQLKRAVMSCYCYCYMLHRSQVFAKC